MIALALAILIMEGGTALADQSDKRLDPLFAQLRAADDAAAARLIEAEIWDIWLRSDDQTVNDLMAFGVARLNHAEYDLALAAFDQIVQRAPNFAEGWNKRATTLYLLGRFADSEKDIDRVLALEPRHFGALSGLGLCDARLNRTKEALEDFRRAQAIDPNLPGVAENIEEMKKRLARESI